MGNDSTKSKKTKAQKPAVAFPVIRDSEITKHALILYKSWSERATEIMEYFYDALIQARTAGCVEISSENTVDLSKHDDEYVRNLTSQWLMSEDNVVILCITAGQADHFPREAFIDKSGKLPSNLIPLVFGTEIPSLWPECYSLGIAHPEKIARPNDFETKGLELLGAVIRGSLD